MATHLSLSWDAYQDNICSGLSLLQQRGEFVDMTLAADGHHVKVHQMVLSLVSPYIKDLISTAQCPHPVIFLNSMSYKTLSSILEYIYTGEVRVPKEQLLDVIAAGRALHIKGLQEMDDTKIFQGDTRIAPDDTKISEDNTSISQDDTSNIPLADSDDPLHVKTKGVNTLLQPVCKIFVDADHPPENNPDEENTEMKHEGAKQNEHKLIPQNRMNVSDTVQYSFSTQGGLQMIVNRYIYTLKYVQKQRRGFWRCVNCANKKCRAILHTNEKKQIIKRTFPHNHPYHDEKILKKIQQGIIFTAYNEAEEIANKKKMAKKGENQENDLE